MKTLTRKHDPPCPSQLPTVSHPVHVVSQVQGKFAASQFSSGEDLQHIRLFEFLQKQDTEEALKEEDNFLHEYHQKRLQQLKAESEKYVLGTRFVTGVQKSKHFSYKTLLHCFEALVFKIHLFFQLLTSKCSVYNLFLG